MSQFDYDLYVIGGGSGGVRAARTAAATGARVALAEASRLGGTCVIRGCVPKKLMVFASSYPEAVAAAGEYGWQVEMGGFDWPRFLGRLRGELDRLEQVYGDLLGQSGVTVHSERVRVAGPHEIAREGGGTASAKHILVAAGGAPVRPDLGNADLGLVSDDLFHLETLPSSLLIVGGGYIGCEFACIMAGFGVEVTMYLRGGQILNGFDEECRGLVSEMMRARGIDIHTGTTIMSMGPAADGAASGPIGTGSDAAAGAPEKRDAPHEGGARAAGPLRVKSTNGREAVFERVLFATGRRPNTDGLGLEEVGVRLGRHGEVEVNEYSQSSVPSIYAIGDVTDRVALTPVAIREGMAFTRTVFEGADCPVDHALIPSAVFTRPELGTVGMTEEAAREDRAIDVYCTSFRPMRSAFIDRANRTLLKLVVDSATRVVLGAHIVADDAGELIQMLGIAVKNGLTKEQFDATCAVHPTISEELVTMSQPVRSG